MGAVVREALEFFSEAALLNTKARLDGMQHFILNVLRERSVLFGRGLSRRATRPGSCSAMS
jgi:hypothetical protein